MCLRHADTFTLYDSQNTQSEVVARYTYLCELVDGKWLIAYHLSSAMPEPLLKSQIEWTFKKWAAALATRDPKQVAALYAKDAVLLPTVSNVRRNTPELTTSFIDYFKSFVAKNPVPVINQGKVAALGPDVAMYVGVYTFSIKDKSNVTGRFSYTNKKYDNDWLITNLQCQSSP